MSDIVVSQVQVASTQQEIDQVNTFFNSREVKQDLHWFTYRDTLERAVERDERELFYVTDDDIIGALMVWYESRVLEPEEAQIRLVAVSPGYREMGIGRRLCKEAELFAAESSQELIFADVAQESLAVDFWQACGYQQDETWETKKGRAMFRMTKELEKKVTNSSV